MVYRAIGLMSGSSLDGLDIAFAEFHENAGKWTYEIKAAECSAYETEWIDKLKQAIHLPALDYQLLHTAYGHYTGHLINKFIEKNSLQYQVQLIASHGHTTFHVPAKKMTGQLGCGAAIAAVTGINTVSDLRAMDIAMGGQGAPIVPIGEKLLLGDYNYFLNLGGIANISFNTENYTAFDVCPANRVLNMLAKEAGKEYDDKGAMAKSGTVNNALLEKLNALDFYKQLYPKSLANDFGTEVVYPMIKKAGISTNDALRTMTEHTAAQIKNSIVNFQTKQGSARGGQLLATGGGVFNDFLIERLAALLKELNIEVVVPDEKLAKYKEALIMALIGVLRWREEYNVLSSVTGAAANSVGGAVWMGADK
jgi:anhydro-N-acetylmuramic acid kinase